MHMSLLTLLEFPTDSELLMITRGPEGVGDKYFTPKLYRDGTCCDVEIMGRMMP